MSMLTIVSGTERFYARLPVSQQATQSWFSSATAPDVRVFSWLDGQIPVYEVEASNCSLVIGDKTKTKPRLHAEVQIIAPRGWRLVETNVRPFPTDWPMGRASWRRFALIQNASDEAEAREAKYGRFCPSWAQRRASYGPCGMPLPQLGSQQTVAMTSIDTARARMIRNALWAKTAFHIEDYSDGVLLPGPDNWMCHGPADPGDVAGSGIYFFNGHRQNLADLRAAHLIAQCEHDRMKRWYQRSDGEPISTEHYPGQITPDTWGQPFIPPEANIADNGGDPLPTPYDFAHLIRGIRRTIQFAEQADSPMAKFAVRGIAAEQRLRFSERGRLPVPGYNPVNLHALQVEAEKAPNTGLFGPTCGRQIGWPAFCIAESMRLSGMIGGTRSWGEAYLKLIETASMQTGVIQKAIGGPFPDHAFTCQTFEQVILAYGTVGIAKQLGVSTPVAVHRMLESIYGPRTQVPILPWASQRGPPHFLVTADQNGIPLPVLKDGAADGAVAGDATHAMSALAIAAHIDPAPMTWVARGQVYGNPFADWKAKLAWLTSGSITEIAWDAGWVAQAQKVAAA